MSICYGISISMGLFARASYQPMPIAIAAVPVALSTSNLPGSETAVLSPSSYDSCIHYKILIIYYYGFTIYILLYYTNSTFARVGIRRRRRQPKICAPAGRNRSGSDISRCRLSSAQIRNHKDGYFLPLVWAVRVMLLIDTIIIMR